MKLLYAIVLVFLATPVVAQTTMEKEVSICNNCLPGKGGDLKKNAPQVKAYAVEDHLQVVVDGPDTLIDISSGGIQYLSDELYFKIPNAGSMSPEWQFAGGKNLNIEGVSDGVVIDVGSAGVVIDVGSAGVVIDVGSAGVVIDVTSAGYKIYGISDKGVVNGTNATFTPGLKNIGIVMYDGDNTPVVHVATFTGISYPTLLKTKISYPTLLTPISMPTLLTGISMPTLNRISMPTLQRLTILGRQQGLSIDSSGLGELIFGGSIPQGLSSATITGSKVYAMDVYTEGTLLTLKNTSVVSLYNDGTINSLKLFDSAIGKVVNEGTIHGFKDAEFGQIILK